MYHTQSKIFLPCFPKVFNFQNNDYVFGVITVGFASKRNG